MILTLYILLVILQTWFIRNTAINWFNREITYCYWVDSYTYNAMVFAYILCIVPIFPLILYAPKYWTLRYIKPKN